MSLQSKLAYHYHKNIQRIETICISLVDLIVYLVTPRKSINLEEKGARTYLFLCHDLPPHFPRIVKWMRRKMNLNAVLLVASRGEFTGFNTEHFAQVITFRSIWQLRQRLASCRGYDLIYTTGAIAWPMRIGMQMSRTPVVFDVKDTYIINYGFHPPQLYMRLDLKNEKYALQHADGIVSQSIEAYFAYKYYGITKRPPSLFFPLYCDDDYLVERNSPYAPDELHLVYVGGFYGSTSSKAHFGNEIFFDIIDRFTSQRIHFHLYPAPRINPAIIQEYKEYAKTTPYLHIHDSVRQDLLAAEIAQYHFGLVPFFNERTKRLNAKRERGTALKIFNYMEAGLPIIISNHCVFEKWLASRYGSAIGIELEDLDRLRELLGSYDYATLRKDVLRKRQRVLLGSHIGRLMHFCDNIIVNHRQKTQ